MIRMCGLTKHYRRGTITVPVLSDINLEIEAGEFVAIVGKSGSGKSTLLNVLGILDQYDNGEYHLNAALIKNLPERQAASYRNECIGFVFQSFNLLPFKTAVDNVALPLFYRKVPRKQREASARQLLDRVGLADRVEHYPTEMSGGEQQRVAIARALVNDPPLILADEPTGNLDPATTADVMDLFHEIHREGKTLVMVTHDDAIAKTAQRIIYLRNGHNSG